MVTKLLMIFLQMLREGVTLGNMCNLNITCFFKPFPCLEHNSDSLHYMKMIITIIIITISGNRHNAHSVDYNSIQFDNMILIIRLTTIIKDNN